MNQTASKLTEYQLTSKENAQVLDFIRGRSGSLYLSARELDEAIKKEVGKFQAEMGFFGFAAVEWLIRGLEELAEVGDGLCVTPPKDTPVTRPWLEAEVTRVLEADAAEAADLQDDEFGSCFDAARAQKLMRAWTSQTNYAIFIRVRYLEESLEGRISDHLEEYARGAGPDLNKAGPNVWTNIVRTWLEDLDKGEDRILVGKDLS